MPRSRDSGAPCSAVIPIAAPAGMEVRTRLRRKRPVPAEAGAHHVQRDSAVIMPLSVITSLDGSPEFERQWLDLSRAGGHFLQHPLWGEFKREFGWQFRRVGLSDGRQLVAGAQVLFRPLPLGLSLAYVPRGPVLAARDPDLLRELVAALDRTCRSRRAIFLKVEPDWEDSPEARELLRAAGFIPSFQTVQPRSTIRLDLTPEPEELLARMKAKWRYNIRLAGRRGVVVRPARRGELSHFLDLMAETAARDRFAVHSPEYYRRAWELFVPAGLGTLLMAWYEGMPLAGVFVVQWVGTAIYMYGASSSRERQRMPNHLLQWEAMLWARRQGCHTYDLWGIPDEVGANLEAWAGRTPDRSGGLWGVFRFKQGFGGRVVRTVGAWDRVYRPALYRGYRWVVTGSTLITRRRLGGSEQ